MDKYEFKLSLNEINTLIDERRFDEAAGIADKIDWNRVKSANTLCRISEVYKIVGDYDKSRDIMAIAYQRQPNNPAIVYALCELTIYLYNRDGMQSDLTSSLQLLNEYQKMEPGNPKRHILQYKMYCASPVSNDEKIAVLKQLHDEKPSARWDYELAKVYADAGEQEEAAKAARDVVRRYSGKFADKAQALLENLGEADQTTEIPQEELPEDTAENSEVQTETPAEREEDESAKRTAAELEETAREEKAAEENSPEEAAEAAPVLEAEEVPQTAGENAASEAPAASDVQEGLPITTPEEQHGVDSIQNNVANGMKDILARPYDDKLEQETNGQYAMVMDQPEKKDDQVAGQMSISEVMAEWEKIRSDIRKANDQKRAQRILEDTGSLLADFDETARHGLLEDIEKGVAKQRRQVRSGAYRVSDALPQDRQTVGDRTPENDLTRNETDMEQSGERNVRGPEVFDSDDGYYDDEEDAPEERPAERKIPVTAEDRSDQESPSYQEPGQEREDSQRVSGAEETSEPAAETYEEKEERQRADERRYRSPREDDEMDDVATRRWNSEEIHRAMARQEQLAREEELENARARREDRKPRRPVKPAPEPEYEEVPEAEPEDEEVPEAEPESEYEEAPETEPEYGENPEPAEYEENAEAEPEYEEQTPEEPVQEEPAEEPVPEETVPAEAPRRERHRRKAPKAKRQPVETSVVEEEPEEPAEDEEEPAPEEKSAPETDETSETEEEMETGGEETGEAPAAGKQPKQKTPVKKSSPDKNPKDHPKNPQAGRRELTKEERRLFGPFCRMKANVNQLLEALDQISLASSTGNLMILGNEATADRVAKGILEIQRHSDSNFTGKIAKVSGGSLNKLDAGGFTKTFAKLENGALIINKAADIAPKTMERLYQELEGRDHGIILIMTDSNKKMEQFRRENAKYLESFTAVINIRPLDDKALVAYARDYAMSQDYSIDEFGQLALAQRISTMQTSTHRVTLKEVRDLVDEAISYASRKTPHTLMEIISRKRYDENDRIIIHEKDFQHY